MLAIGRALVGSPKLLLVDEPSEGLAPMVVNEIFQLLARMRDGGIALLLVEQNVRRASAISSSCYVMEKGQVIKHGAPAMCWATMRSAEAISVKGCEMTTQIADQFAKDLPRLSSPCRRLHRIGQNHIPKAA